MHISDKERTRLQHNHGYALAQAGNLQEAERELCAAYAAASAAHGHTSINTALAALNYGAVLAELGELDKAESLIGHAGAIWRDAGTGHERGLSDALCSLARVSELRGDYRRAVRRYREAMPYCASGHGAESARYGLLMRGVALAIRSVPIEEIPELLDNKSAHAIGAQVSWLMLSEANNILNKALGANHPDYLFTLSDLADETREHDPKQAFEAYTALVRLAPPVLGEDHSIVVNALCEAGVLAHQRGDLELAESLHLQTSLGSRATLGNWVLNRLNLSSVQIGLKKWRDAEQTINSLKGDITRLGRELPVNEKLALALNEANVRYQIGAKAKAKKIIEDAIASFSGDRAANPALLNAMRETHSKWAKNWL